MKYLHTMVRVRDLDASLRFFCDGLGLREMRRMENPQGRFTLVFLAAPESPEAEIELTYNWRSDEDYGSARNFGHLAFRVDDIYATCAHLQAMGVTINRPPRDGHMAFVRSPDLISIELLQKGDACRRRSRGRRCRIPAAGSALERAQQRLARGPRSGRRHVPARPRSAAGSAATPDSAPSTDARCSTSDSQPPSEVALVNSRSLPADGQRRLAAAAHLDAQHRAEIATSAARRSRGPGAMARPG